LMTNNEIIYKDQQTNMLQWHFTSESVFSITIDYLSNSVNPGVKTDINRAVDRASRTCMMKSKALIHRWNVAWPILFRFLE
jgi:hypothetical protein